MNGSGCRDVTVPVKCYGGLFAEDAYANFTTPEVNCTSETGLKKNPGPEGITTREKVMGGT